MLGEVPARTRRCTRRLAAASLGLESGVRSSGRPQKSSASAKKADKAASTRSVEAGRGTHVGHSAGCTVAGGAGGGIGDGVADEEVEEEAEEEDEECTVGLARTGAEGARGAVSMEVGDGSGDGEEDGVWSGCRPWWASRRAREDPACEVAGAGVVAGASPPLPERPVGWDSVAAEGAPGLEFDEREDEAEGGCREGIEEETASSDDENDGRTRVGTVPRRTASTRASAAEADTSRTCAPPRGVAPASRAGAPGAPDDAGRRPAIGGGGRRGSIAGLRGSTSRRGAVERGSETPNGEEVADNGGQGRCPASVREGRALGLASAQGTTDDGRLRRGFRRAQRREQTLSSRPRWSPARTWSGIMCGCVGGRH